MRTISGWTDRPDPREGALFGIANNEQHPLRGFRHGKSPAGGQQEAYHHLCEKPDHRQRGKSVEELQLNKTQAVVTPAAGESRKARRKEGRIVKKSGIGEVARRLAGARETGLGRGGRRVSNRRGSRGSQTVAEDERGKLMTGEEASRYRGHRRSM